MSRSQSGSTMTINTIGNGKDDVSIYNGDENHKVCQIQLIFLCGTLNKMKVAGLGR